MCALMLIAGLPIAPAAAACYGLVGALAVPNTTTEAFAWLGTAIVTGIALGTSVEAQQSRTSASRARSRSPRRAPVSQLRSPSHGVPRSPCASR